MLLSVDEINIFYGELHALWDVSVHVREKEIVALLLERSFEMMIAILAVWKAGGAYMPINHDYPDERLSYLLDDSKTKALLTVSGTRIPACYQALRINLDEEPTAPGKNKRLKAAPAFHGRQCRLK